MRISQSKNLDKSQRFNTYEAARNKPILTEKYSSNKNVPFNLIMKSDKKKLYNNIKLAGLNTSKRMKTQS
jgi:hypothetical protein